MFEHQFDGVARTEIMLDELMGAVLCSIKGPGNAKTFRPSKIVVMQLVATHHAHLRYLTSGLLARKRHASD